MSLYHIFSLTKMAVAIMILLLLYFTIDPYSDPLIAISWGMVWFFLLARWCSFFFFRWWNKYIKKINTEEEKNITQSYKLSLLFGIYILFNIIFLLKERRTILWWVILLIWFIFIQSILLPSVEQKNK